jgi:hypothetical protein
MRAERVAEEVEAFLSGVSQRSFRLVDRQPELASKGVRQGLALAEKLGAKVTFLSVVAPLAPDAIRAAIAGGIPDPKVAKTARSTRA